MGIRGMHVHVGESIPDVYRDGVSIWCDDAGWTGAKRGGRVMDLETKGFKLVDRMNCLTNTFVGILMKDADDGAFSGGEKTRNCGDG